MYKKSTIFLKEWNENEDNIYIGRKGIVFINKERYPKKDSKWSNPFKVKGNITRKKSILMYIDYI